MRIEYSITRNGKRCKIWNGMKYCRHKNRFFKRTTYPRNTLAQDIYEYYSGEKLPKGFEIVHINGRPWDDKSNMSNYKIMTHRDAVKFWNLYHNFNKETKESYLIRKEDDYQNYINRDAIRRNRALYGSRKYVKRAPFEERHDRQYWIDHPEERKYRSREYKRYERIEKQ